MKESEMGPGGPGKGGIERRQFARRATNMPVMYRRLDEDNIPVELEHGACRAVDISRGGICVEVELALRVGQNVAIFSEGGKDEKPIRAIGTVVRIVRRRDHFEAGIAFQKPD